MHPKKSLGQNFLMHRRIAERIAHTAELSKDTLILEIGPGTGMLTRALLEEGRRVLAIEADAELLTTLEETFAAELGTGQLVLLHQDIRLFDTATISEPYTLVANIPYYITGEILRQFLTASKKPLSMTVLVQKEVAVRIARSKKESLLSLSVKAFGTPSYAFTVPRGAFYPAPNVDSAVLHIRDIQQDAFSSSEIEKRFFEVLKAGFAHKRKLLAGNLGVLATTQEIQSAFVSADIPSKARAEDVSLSKWRTLAEVLRV
jgi:16S rRNA (adenine1518-N6/adenine1519-N6)-dimethyltransferase